MESWNLHQKITFIFHLTLLNLQFLKAIAEVRIIDGLCSMYTKDSKLLNQVNQRPTCHYKKKKDCFYNCLQKLESVKRSYWWWMYIHNIHLELIWFFWFLLSLYSGAFVMHARWVLRFMFVKFTVVNSYLCLKLLNY